MRNGKENILQDVVAVTGEYPIRRDKPNREFGRNLDFILFLENWHEYVRKNLL